MKEYKHLSSKERRKIYFWKQAGNSLADIALRLNRSRSTIHREISRNSQKGHYLPDTAHYIYKSRYKGRPRSIIVDSPLYYYILNKLKAGWSPEQISGRMRYLRKSYYICHETIYSYIYRSHKNKEWYKFLTKSKPMRGKRFGRSVGSGKYSGIKLISERPTEVMLRNKLGHWEFDTIGFQNCKHQNISTLVERKSRYVIMIKNKNRQSDHVLGKIRSFMDLCKHFKTITNDQGSEFAHYKLLEKGRCKVYFCNPHSPWQRGTNENTNGRIRRYLPREYDINLVTQRKLDLLSWKLNNTPRKVLGYRAPRELLSLPRMTHVALLT